MPSNGKTSSTVIHNNPESSCIYRRSSKRKLQPQPVHNTYASPCKTSTENQNKKVSFLSTEEEQSNQKLVILECEDMNAFSENFCKRPFNSQKYLPPTNERNANGNVFILQQEEHMNPRNMQRKDDNFGATEDNAAVSSSIKADFAKPVKDLQFGDTSFLSDPIMNEGQNHAGSVPSGLQLPMTTLLAAKPFSQRDRTEEPQKATIKSESSTDGSRTSGYSAIRIIPKSDEFDSIGQNIAAKLRRLPREQGILAEKLLNDIMYEAAMGTLNRGSRLWTPPAYGTNWGNMPFSSSLVPNNSLNEFNMYSRFYGFYNQ